MHKSELIRIIFINGSNTRIVGGILLRNRLKFKATPENVMHHGILSLTPRVPFIFFLLVIYLTFTSPCRIFVIYSDKKNCHDDGSFRVETVSNE